MCQPSSAAQRSTAHHTLPAPLSCSGLRYGPDQVFYHVLADCRDWPAPQGEDEAPPVAYVAEECLAPASSADFAAEEPLVVSTTPVLLSRPFLPSISSSSCHIPPFLSAFLRMACLPAQGIQGMAHAAYGHGPWARPRACRHSLLPLRRGLQGGALEHPYGYLMFLGADGEGNMVPCRQLRDKYGAARRDVHPGGDGEAAEGDEDGSGGQGGGGGAGPDGGRGPTRLPGIDMRSLD